MQGARVATRRSRLAQCQASRQVKIALEPNSLDGPPETPATAHLGLTRPGGLSLASLIVGPAALMIAIAPSAIRHEPPVWWRCAGLSGEANRMRQVSPRGWRCWAAHLGWGRGFGASRAISKAGVILSTRALTWENVLPGVLIAVVIVVIENRLGRKTG